MNSENKNDLNKSIQKVQDLLWQCQDEINKQYDYFKSKEASKEAVLARNISQKIYAFRLQMSYYSL